MASPPPEFQHLVQTLADRVRSGRGREPGRDLEALQSALTRDLASVRRRFPALATVPLAELERAQRECLDRVAAAADNPATTVAAGLAAGPVLELTAQGRADLAERLLAELASATDDFELFSFIDCLERQRAIERAATSESAEEARRFVLLALATRRSPVLPPVLVAVGGLVASGKSTVAHWIAERMNVPRIEADRVRTFLARGDDARSLAPEMEGAVYEEMLRRAGRVLASGRSVVLDGCFPRAQQRDRARDMARARSWPFLFVECRVDAETTRARLAERERARGSGSWTGIAARLAKRWQATDHLPDEELLVLDCGRPLTETQARLQERLPLEPPGGAPLP